MRQVEISRTLVLDDPRRARLSLLALAVGPRGFTVAQFTAQIRAMTGQTPEQYSTRHGAYGRRKRRGKQLVTKPCSARRSHVAEAAAHAITALLTIRDKVIAPLAAGIRTPRRGRPPNTWTTIDRDYGTLRLNMQTLINHLGIATKATAGSTTFCRSRPAILLAPNEPCSPGSPSARLRRQAGLHRLALLPERRLNLVLAPRPRLHLAVTSSARSSR
jgi:hypothetical protein